MSRFLIAMMAALTLFTGTDAEQLTHEKIAYDRTPVTVQIPDSPDPSSDPTDFYLRRVIRMHYGIKGVKVLGERNLASAKGIFLDYTCSGVEFNANCCKKIGFKLNLTDACSFKVYVDGELYLNGNSDYFQFSRGKRTLVISVSKGIHNIKLIKVSHYRQAQAELTDVILYGKILPEGPEEKDSYIEFIGDSLICGWGVVGDHNGTYLSCDGTLAWSYLISQNLDADYSMFGISGQGAFCGDPSVQDCYLLTSYARCREKFDFRRRPDIVVINLGTNDYTAKTGEEDFRTAFLNIINMVRQKYGQDEKILIVYNMKNDGYGSVLRMIAQQENLAIYKCSRSTNKTAYCHPSIEENEQYAAEITAVIRNLLNN